MRANHADEWLEAYVHIMTSNPFRVTRTDLHEFYRRLWADCCCWLDEEPPAERCDPLAYIAWFKGLGMPARHIGDIFLHVQHEFTAAEHAEIMRLVVAA